MDAIQALIFNVGRRPATSWAKAGKFLRKISVFGATRCRILMLKCTKFDFHWGYRWGSLQHSSDPLPVFKRANFYI